MSYVRTAEHRAKQAEKIRSWRPWEKSTGPRTETGKRNSAVRGYRGAERSVMREVSTLLRDQARLLAICMRKN